jgi:hypothetical protein
MPYIPAVLRAKIRRKFHDACAYRLSPEHLMGVIFEIDHIIPLVEGGAAREDNLCLCCPTCNRYKATHIVAIDPLTQKLCSLFHPLLDKWDDHFQWINDFTHLLGKTATGRATIELLRMNRPILVELRSYWKELGLHPLIVK